MASRFYCRKKERFGKCNKSCEYCNRAAEITFDPAGNPLSPHPSGLEFIEDPFYIDHKNDDLTKKLKELGWGI